MATGLMRAVNAAQPEAAALARRLPALPLLPEFRLRQWLSKMTMVSSVMTPVPMDGIIDLSATVDIPEGDRPTSTGADFANWKARGGRRNMPAGLIYDGVAWATGAIDFPTGIRSRTGYSRAYDDLMFEPGDAALYTPIPIAGNTFALAFGRIAPSYRLLGVEIVLSVSPINFAPYNVRITNDPTLSVTGLSPVPPVSWRRGVGLVRDVSLRVFTENLGIFLPLAVLEPSQNQSTPAVDLGDCPLATGAGKEAYLSSLPSFKALQTRAGSFFVAATATVTSATIAPIANSAYAGLRAMPSIEEG
jgi:hypothetical protein